ncbi:tetratricopeptide repeat protein [Kiritimatiella glycovorans]|uniref:Tol-pal system protein YbgF n=1 Tax=Kiritimatiella glycovorans TaxID=1307763 RepID=A0A0G3EF34_9BACT|nr:tetratricopeptide repeat protein [Kiritimatiella glycovorans]AKJ64042.1 tol-pal system protein YbgF [Kiritimatiella glycovorans]
MLAFTLPGIPFTGGGQEPGEVWGQAQQARENGQTGRALKLYSLIAKKWPASPYAARAQQFRADLLREQGKKRRAREEYVELLREYGNQISTENALQSLFELATDAGNRRRFNWVFGGFKTPEAALPALEAILKYGPNWDRAPEAQFMIGKIHEGQNKPEEAIAAYAKTEYRYPRSEYAEKAAYRRVHTLVNLSRETPYSSGLREKALTACRMFVETYPQSGHADEVRELRAELTEARAEALYERAVFYDKISHQPDSALIYYRRLLDEFPNLERAEDARKRIAELEADDDKPETPQ